MIEKQKPLSWYLANVDMDTLMQCMNVRGDAPKLNTTRNLIVEK